MCLCAAMIGPDLGSITYTVSLFSLSYTFLILSVYGDLGLKTRLSRGNEREGRKCAWPTWKAWLGLPFDMIISAILEQLGSKVYFPPFFLKHTFDFDALCMPQMTNSRVSVSSERLLKGFHLICSSLQSDFIWVRGFAPCESCWYFSSAPVGKNLGLSQCSQHICQDCQRCKCESWRLEIAIVWCAHLCNQVQLAFEESLARLQGDSNMHICGRRCWPSDPCCTMICSLKGISVQVNSEGLG